MSQNKKFNVKFFSDPSTLVETVRPDISVEEIHFDSRINGGVGEFVLTLSLPFDDFVNHVSFIDFMNIAKIYEIDENNKTGRQIYTGYVSKYIPIMTTKGEFVEVTLLGLNSLLTESMWGNAPLFDHSYSGVEPSTIAREIIDDINSIFGNWITYETSGANQTVFNVGTNVSYDFEQMTHLQALTKLMEVTEEGWYFHIDGKGRFHFREKASSAELFFQIGKDVQEMKIETTIEELFNDITVQYSGGSTLNVSDAASISAYGRRKFMIVDEALGDPTSAQQRADKELAEKKSPKIMTKMIINNLYDIENIRCGQTCKVRGLKKGSTVLNDNMHIIGFKYDVNTIALELEERKTFAQQVSKV